MELALFGSAYKKVGIIDLVMFALLRDFFQDELVDYSRGQGEFSPLAEQLRPRVAEILKASRKVVALSRGFDPATDTRTMTVAAPEFLSYFIIPQLSAIFAVDAPRISLEAIVDSSTERNILERADAVIAPGWAADPRAVKKPLCVEEIGCLVPADSELIAKRGAKTYLSRRHVTLQDFSSFRC